MKNNIVITDTFHIGVMVIKDNPEYYLTLRERIEIDKKKSNKKGDNKND